VALSGYNISIIASAILLIFLFLGINRRRAFWFSVLTILLFIVMAGASASIIRAAIMGVLLLLGQNVGKIYHPRNALLFAALIMVILNPKIIRFDLGFQLSFLATLGLIYFSPWFNKIIKADKNSFLNWRQNLATTLSAQLAVMPLLVSQFNNFSLIAPLVNILVLTFIPITMLLGFIMVLLGTFSSLLGSVFGFFAYLLLKYEIGVINYFGQLKFASVNLGKYSLYFSWIIIIGGFLVFLFFRARKIKYGKEK
jgi:competence protein ComEC